jgi:hypothetical protein
MTQKQMVKWADLSFPKGRSPNGQRKKRILKHDEMCNISGHKVNANQNHIKIPTQSCYEYHQEQTTTNVEKEPSTDPYKSFL